MIGQLAAKGVNAKPPTSRPAGRVHDVQLAVTGPKAQVRAGVRREGALQETSGRTSAPSSCSRRTRTVIRTRRSARSDKELMKTSAARMRSRRSWRRFDTAYPHEDRRAVHCPGGASHERGSDGEDTESYLPPPELRPQRLYTLDEFKNIPQKLNSTEILLDRRPRNTATRSRSTSTSSVSRTKQLQASVNASPTAEEARRGGGRPRP